MSNSEVDTVVHHFTECPESLRWDVEEQDLGTRNVCRPIKLVGFVTTYNQYVALVDDDNLSFTYLLVIHLEAGPLEAFEVIECVLVELREVEELLANGLT